MTFDPNLFVINDAKFADQVGPDSDRPTMIQPRDVGTVNFSTIPPRPWVYGMSSLLGFVCATGGPGGTGKTSIEIAKAMSVATGRSLLTDGEDDDELHKVHVRGNVLYWNTEDPEDEMLRRILAEMNYRGVKQEELAGKFYVLSSTEGNRLKIAEIGKEGNLVSADTESFIELCLALNIVLFVADPLVNTHSLKENDNDHQNFTLARFREIAQRANVAILVVHHFRKGGKAGDAESFRGAVAMRDGFRSAETVTTMTPDEAKALGVDESDRFGYVSLTNAKANLGPAGKQQWFKFVAVALNNGTLQYPIGDYVGVLDRWIPHNAMHGVAWNDLEKVLDLIDAGVDGEYYSKTKQNSLWVGDLLKEHFHWEDAKTALQIKEWLSSKLLIEDTYKSPNNYREKKRVVVSLDGRVGVRQRMDARA